MLSYTSRVHPELIVGKSTNAYISYQFFLPESLPQVWQIGTYRRNMLLPVVPSSPTVNPRTVFVFVSSVPVISRKQICSSLLRIYENRLNLDSKTQQFSEFWPFFL